MVMRRFVEGKRGNEGLPRLGAGEYSSGVVAFTSHHR
jgi:hypothetical protein